MAAYAALVSLMNDLELLQNHPRHSFSFENKQIASLSQTVHFLIDFMENYDSHGCTVQVLESRIASAALAAHDVVESHVVDQIHAGTTLDGKARSYFLLDLQKAIDNMGFVKRKAMQFKAKCGIKAEQITFSPPASSQPLSSGKNFMVGFDAVLVRLMEMLTSDDSSRLVIPIVGMGGMGKTTLARNAYDHLLIEDRFDVRHWSTISQEYSVGGILTELISGKRNSAGGNVNELGDQLHKKLWGRRYLIILDDMWSLEAWDEVHLFLPDNGNGSRVIVTTRLSKLATNLSGSPFKMNFLDEDQSWELFCGKAFEEEEECPVELEGIGRRIVKRCRGHPLSIIVIGGHLRKSWRAIEYWEKVVSSINPIWSLGEDENCMNIVSLSYHQLPICLKPCFLYFGNYPEDQSIRARDLLRLWVAEGFVKAKEGVSLEEVAEDYLEDLIDRNLVILCRRRWNGKAEYCGIHDIVREFCLKVGKKEKFLCVLDTTQTQALLMERRIAIPRVKQISDIDNALESAPLLRSLIQLDRLEDGNLSVELRLLRVSDYVQANICSPEADIRQVNLRYFAPTFFVSRDRDGEICSLPWSISLCWNLQTINMGNYLMEISAPQEIWEMAQLRHLVFNYLYLPDPLPVDQQEFIILQNLQTLEGVKNLRLTEEFCERMPNIKELRIWYNVQACSDCYPCNLGRFNKLESLRLFGCDSVQSFTFPSSLQELHLMYSSVDWEDFGMIIKSLPHLGLLSLTAIKGEEWNLAVEEKFPRLKYLRIWECDDLIYWNANSSHFPVLETLDIQHLPRLSEIPFDMGEIATLACINVQSCSVSAAVSAMRIAVEQHITCGNDHLQLHVSFFYSKEVERFQKLVQEYDLKTNCLRLSCMESLKVKWEEAVTKLADEEGIKIEFSRFNGGFRLASKKVQGFNWPQKRYRVL